MSFESLNVSRTIDDKDGMAKGSKEKYFKTGKNALMSIRQAMNVSGIRQETVNAVLDYACGYGRVLRWLSAEFPNAIVNGLDIDKAAVTSARQNLGVDVEVLDPTLPGNLARTYDLIWVGSLFTHLPESEMLRVLAFLRDQLSSKGLLVFTGHGDFVFNRINTGEKTYNLSVDGQRKLIKEYSSGKFAFAPYTAFESYGIALTHPAAVFDMLSRTKLSPVMFKARGWVRHQDVYACQKL